MRKLTFLPLFLLALTVGSAVGQPLAVPVQRPAIDGIMEAFQSHPLVGLGDAHGLAQQQDFYAALVRDPRFAREVGNVVVEFGNAVHQPVIDRYIDGQDVSYDALRKVWTDPVGWAPPPAYLGFVNLLAQMRATNLSLPPAQRMRVWLGDPPLDWSKVAKREDVGVFPWSLRDSFPADLIVREILDRNRKALVIYGGFHLNRDAALQTFLGPQPSLVMRVEEKHPGSFFTVGVYPGFKSRECADLFEADKKDWRTPLLMLPVRGTALDDPQFRRRCPIGNLKASEDITARLHRLLIGMDGDAWLYLGPTASLTHSPILPDAYLDEVYRKEILRHWSIFGMSADEADMAVDKNPASPRPFGY